jgi:hypothetical protein
MRMAITIKPSDLYNRYPRDVARRSSPKFGGKPDHAPFNRDDLYEVIPMLEKVMDELGLDDARSLHTLEEVMLRDMPRFIISREEVFDFLTGCMRELLNNR